MAAKASSLGVALRPHIKTHKCCEIGRMQLDRGACGLTVSTLSEAESFAASGFGDLTHAFPLDPGKTDRALELSERVVLRLTLDDLDTAKALESTAERRGLKINVWLKVDCGYHRAGVDPDSGYALDLARFLHEAPHIIFYGLLTHAGHAYKAGSRKQIQDIARQERDVPVQFALKLRSEGIVVDIISVGSTPTISVVEDLAGVQEIRPGNYVFHDRTQVALGSCTLEDCAVTVLATIVSHQPSSSQVVVDAGALALSHDPGPIHQDLPTSRGALIAGTNPLKTHPDIHVESLSQEHGIIRALAPESLADLRVGTRVRILPNHSCLTVALFDHYMVVKGQEVVDQWTIHRSRA
ncbi:MAG: alanine racemase [Fidelibacterota bacterium]|nr:MAG: alanine racemase [Candidatus Neomarinimicrobiota bacterium]